MDLDKSSDAPFLLCVSTGPSERPSEPNRVCLPCCDVPAMFDHSSFRGWASLRHGSRCACRKVDCCMAWMSPAGKMAPALEPITPLKFGGGRPRLARGTLGELHPLHLPGNRIV